MLPCHSILEYNEYRLFSELGHDGFSLGSLINPLYPHDPKRPAVEGKVHEQLISVSQVHTKDNLHEEQVMWADIIIVHHIPDWIIKNWTLFEQAIKKGKRIVWRTIGQSLPNIESVLQPYRERGLEIVRYSPRERLIPGYIGEDACIRFHQYDDELKNWNGHDERIVTVAQAMKKRKEFCHFDVFEKATRGMKRVLYGPSNDDAGELQGGVLTYDDLKQVMRDSRVFFYTGTQPASYTLGGSESMVTGTPIVSIGAKLGNSIFKLGLFEMPDIIVNGENGFISDDIGELHDYCQALLNDYDLAKRISKAGRETAIEYFGVSKIRDQWKEFLER